MDFEIKRKWWVVDEFVDLFKRENPEYKIEDDMGRLYFIKGKSDCIEFTKSHLTLTAYKHSSQECKDLRDKLEKQLTFIAVCERYFV